MRIGKQGAANASNQQGHQNRGEGQHHVTQAHQNGVDPASLEARQQTQGDADNHGQENGDKAHHQRNAGPVKQGRQDVAPLVVGAEQVFAGALCVPGRWFACIVQIEGRQIERVVGRNPAGKCGAKQADKRHSRCRHGNWRRPEAVAHIAVEPPRNEGVAFLVDGQVDRCVAHWIVGALFCGWLIMRGAAKKKPHRCGFFSQGKP